VRYEKLKKKSVYSSAFVFKITTEDDTYAVGAKDLQQVLSYLEAGGDLPEAVSIVRLSDDQAKREKALEHSNLLEALEVGVSEVELPFLICL